MIIVEGLLLGLAYVLAPGPVIVETVRRSLLGGVRTALAVQLGALGGHTLCAILVVVGVAHLLLNSSVQLWVGLLGGLLLIYVGMTTLHGWRSMGARITALSQSDVIEGSVMPPLWRHASAGLTVALLSPYGLVFWMSVGGTTLDRSAGALGGFFLGGLLASMLIALVAGQLHRQSTLRFACWIWAGCGGVLMLLGLKLGYSAFALW